MSRSRPLSFVASLMLGLALVALPVLAQPQVASGTDQAAVTNRVLDQVLLDTSAGEIIIALEPDAPVTSANFLRYVDEGRLDGTDFYRSMVIASGIGLIQGGTNNRPERVLAPVVHEATNVTGLTHRDGAVSMARHDPGTATGDFFIIVGDVRSLDANRVSAGDPGFAVFGRVVQGMDIVRQILISPTSPTQGEGFMRGQMLDPPVQIRSARRMAQPLSLQAD